MSVNKSNMWPNLIGILVCSQAVIHLELFFIRATSVILWHHHTPLVISLAFFGFGISGIVLALFARSKNTSNKSIASDSYNSIRKGVISFRLSLLLAGVIPLSFIVFTRLPLLSAVHEGAITVLFYWLIALICLGLPFFISGILIGLWLVFSPEKVSVYYGFNLIGSAIGAVSYLVAISLFKASGSIFFISCLFLAASFSFSLNSGVNRMRLLSGLLLPVGIILIFLAETVLPVRAPTGKRAFDIPPENIAYSGWNAISRIDVIRPTFSNESLLTVLIDGGAATTYIPRIQNSLEQEDPDRVRSGNPLIHRIRKQPTVLILGSGGGVDVRDFLVNGARRVTAVEINPLMNTLVEREFNDVTNNLYGNPRVVVVNEDGRSFLAQTKERFDIIHLGLPITNAALASGALNLAEDSLLTEEALKTYLNHLTPGGVLYMLHDEVSAFRFAVTADSVFRQKGWDTLSQSLVVLMHPSFHINFPISQGRTELFIKNGAFTKDELYQVSRYASRYGFIIRYAPGQEGNTYFHHFFSNQLTQEDTRLFPGITKPTSDDRPFFNHLVSWGTLLNPELRSIGSKNPLWNRIRSGESSLLLALAILSMLVGLLIIFSILLLRQTLARMGCYHYLAVSFIFGLSFMFTEISFLHWLRMLWGHPETAAMGVLSILLVSAGLGSLSVEYLNRKFKMLIWGALIIIAVSLGAFSLYFSKLIPYLLSSPGWLKACISVFILGSTGFIMGIPFTWILRKIAMISVPLAGSAWMMNIFGSTLGAIIGFMIAMDYGYSNVLMIAAICYGLTLFLPGWKTEMASL